MCYDDLIKTLSISSTMFTNDAISQGCLLVDCWPSHLDGQVESEEDSHNGGGQVAADHGDHGEGLGGKLGGEESTGGEKHTSKNENVGSDGKDAAAGTGSSIILQQSTSEDEDHAEGVPLSGELLSEVVAVKLAVGVLLSGGAGEAEEGHTESLEAGLEGKDSNALEVSQGDARHLTFWGFVA